MSAMKVNSNFVKQITGYISKSNNFDRFLKNLKITGGGEGKCQAELQIGKEHINLHGGLHGGLTATLIENVSNYALMSNSCFPRATLDTQIMYIKAAEEGDALVIDANTIRTDHDSNIAYIECELRRKSDGALIAKSDQMKRVDFEQLNITNGTMF